MAGSALLRNTVSIEECYFHKIKKHSTQKKNLFPLTNALTYKESFLRTTTLDDNLFLSAAIRGD